MQTIERVIVRRLIRAMKAKGYRVAAVWDGEEYQMPGKDGNMTSLELDDAPDNITRPMTEREALESVDSVDECTLHFTHANAKTWGNRGALLVLGNGEDVIADYHCSDPLFDSVFSSLEA